MLWVASSDLPGDVVTSEVDEVESRLNRSALDDIDYRLDVRLGIERSLLAAEGSANPARRHEHDGATVALMAGREAAHQCVHRRLLAR